jgi:NADH-quinone oxidoreductase E subunit
MAKKLEGIFEQYPNRRREDMIPLLQAIQEQHGYLSEETINAVGEYLDISINKIYGVATFYDNFRFGPVGKYHIRLCHGTACHVAGAAKLLKELQRLLKIKDGECDKNGLFSLEVVSCIGACGLAPLIEVNEVYHTSLDAPKLKQLIDSIRENEKNAI